MTRMPAAPRCTSARLHSSAMSNECRPIPTTLPAPSAGSSPRTSRAPRTSPSRWASSTARACGVSPRCDCAWCAATSSSRPARRAHQRPNEGLPESSGSAANLATRGLPTLSRPPSSDDRLARSHSRTVGDYLRPRRLGELTALCGVGGGEFAAYEVRQVRSKSINELEKKLQLDRVRPNRVGVWRIRMPGTMPSRNQARLVGRLGTPSYKSLHAITRDLETHVITIEQPLHHALVQQHHGAAAVLGHDQEPLVEID